MKMNLFAVALASAGLLATSLSAHAQDKGGFFINGNVGQANLDRGAYDDDDTGYGLNLGYRWALSPNVAIGVEGGYTDLGRFSPKPTARLALPDGEFLRRAELKGWTAGVNGHFNLTDNWYLSGRTGLFRADSRGDYLVAGLPVRGDSKNTQWYAGAGFGYDFSNNFSVGLNYDYYKADKNQLKLNTDLVSIGAEVRF